MLTRSWFLRWSLVALRRAGCVEGYYPYGFGVWSSGVFVPDWLRSKQKPPLFRGRARQPRPNPRSTRLDLISTPVATVAFIIMALFGILTLVGGGVIALLASRRAPDGFEDQEGFHMGRVPSEFRPQQLWLPRKKSGVRRRS